MTSEKYLSQKKTTNQTISISPALKEWLQRYVRVEHHKFPEDKRFKSVLAFITHYIKVALVELSST